MRKSVQVMLRTRLVSLYVCEKRGRMPQKRENCDSTAQSDKVTVIEENEKPREKQEARQSM